MRTYSELIRFPTFEERLNYLLLHGSVGSETFGWDRYVNQMLYRSPEWRELRPRIILRDNGCDLGVDGYEINEKILIHHIDPITLQDIENRDPKVFSPENLITTRMATHQIIHYGNSAKDSSIFKMNVRSANDTSPWRR